MTYYEGVKKMEEMGVNDNYIQGWVAGFLNNPEIVGLEIAEIEKKYYNCLHL
jgi:hypothetical protein